MSTDKRDPAGAAPESPAKVTDSILGAPPATEADETPLLADLSAVEDWVERVYPEAPGVLMVNHVDARGTFKGTGGGCPDRASVVARVQELDAAGSQSIYLRAATLKVLPGPHGRGSSSDSFVLPGLWADVDFGTVGHKHDRKKGGGGLVLPPNASEARRIVTESGLPEPTLWVNSGGGLYPWWLFDKPVTISDANRQQLTNLSSDWQEALGRSAARLGYHYGTGVGDLARLLRLPGTVNRKAGRERPCRVIEDTGPEYLVEELYAALAARLGTKEASQNSTMTATADILPSGQAKPGLSNCGVFGVLDQHVSFADLLSGADWVVCTGKHPKSISNCFTRPGEPDHPCSAHVLVDYPSVLVNWSESSGLPVGKDQKLTKARVFAHLWHGGDLSAAAKDLLAATQGRTCTDAAASLALPRSPQPATLSAVQVPTGGYNPGVEPDTAGGKKGPSVATELVHLAEARFEFGISDEGEPFAVPKSGVRIVRMLRGNGSLRAELSRAYFQQHRKVAAQGALADALMVCEGLALEKNPSPLALRVARTDEVTWVDLGEVKGRIVKIDASGWSVIQQAPMLFRRTALTGVMPEPQGGGSLEELWDLLNVTPRYRPIVLAVLVAALIPSISHPVVLLSGEQGSGKSTATRLLVSLLDPSPAPLRTPPRSVEQWVTAAAGSWAVALDNVSEIPDWLSDCLCRASTGDGDVRRRLFSDGDLSVFSFKRVVLLNGIDLARISEDLADRLVNVRLDLIPDAARKEETALLARWAGAYPRILGAVFDLAVKTFAAMPEVELVNPPRMADFARVLAAVDAVLGTDGLAAYRDLGREMATDAVASDFVLSAIIEWITADWTGTAAKLLTAIDPGGLHQDHPGWPATAREMTTVMRQRAPSLRKLGWEVVELPRGGKDKSIRYRLTPPVEPDTVSDE